MGLSLGTVVEVCRGLAWQVGSVFCCMFVGLGDVCSWILAMILAMELTYPLHTYWTYPIPYPIPAMLTTLTFQAATTSLSIQYTISHNMMDPGEDFLLYTVPEGSNESNESDPLSQRYQLSQASLPHLQGEHRGLSLVSVPPRKRRRMRRLVVLLLRDGRASWVDVAATTTTTMFWMKTYSD